MIRYDWNLLSKYSLLDIFTVFYILDAKKDIRNYPDSIKKIIAGFSDLSPFLVNPGGIFRNRKHHLDGEIYLYLSLASKRSYLTFKQSGSVRLPTYYIEHIYNLEKLKLNTMLDVTNDEIIFIYEE